MEKYPNGVNIWSRKSHADLRGSFTEIFRQEWHIGTIPPSIQWNVMHSNANVLRGLHVHLVHHDYYVLLHGQETLVLKDLRENSSTAGLSCVLNLNAHKEICAISIPPGVAHGFYAHTDAVTLVGVSHYYDVEDELNCDWQDPELNIAWPCKNPIVSGKDKDAPSLKALLAQIKEQQSHTTAIKSSAAIATSAELVV